MSIIALATEIMNAPEKLQILKRRSGIDLEKVTDSYCERIILKYRLDPDSLPVVKSAISRKRSLADRKAVALASSLIGRTTGRH